MQTAKVSTLTTYYVLGALIASCAPFAPLLALIVGGGLAVAGLLDEDFLDWRVARTLRGLAPPSSLYRRS